jgi:hypothetical protein
VILLALLTEAYGGATIYPRSLRHRTASASVATKGDSDESRVIVVFDVVFAAVGLSAGDSVLVPWSLRLKSRFSRQAESLLCACASV